MTEVARPGLRWSSPLLIRRETGEGHKVTVMSLEGTRRRPGTLYRERERAAGSELPRQVSCKEF